MEYTVVEMQNDLEKFQTAVTEHINDGWKLVGGVSVVCAPETDNYAGWWFYQAMVKQTE
jgi:hypothetical protein